jgi:stromal membrane-associated protein
MSFTIGGQAHKKPKSKEDRLTKELTRLRKLPENKTCVDCGQRDPSWASINLGVFMCLDCSGIHRNLGVHISQVRSISLDTWTKEWVLVLKKIGNSTSNLSYEADLTNAVRRPSENGGEMEYRKDFIRRKYEHRMWYRHVPPTQAAPQPPQGLKPPPQRTSSREKVHEVSGFAFMNGAGTTGADGAGAPSQMKVAVQPSAAYSPRPPAAGVHPLQQAQNDLKQAITARDYEHAASIQAYMLTKQKQQRHAVAEKKQKELAGK